MLTRLHVANLDHTVTAADLERLFAAHGAVLYAQVMTYPDNGRSTGSGAVDMGSAAAADAAVRALDGRQYRGRPLVIVVVGGAAVAEPAAGSQREIQAMISEGGPALATA
jgi:RNA recognition motif-containing protein